MPSSVTPAGIFAFGSMTINLPAGATTCGGVAGNCTLASINVFAAQPHMHHLGTKMQFEHGTERFDVQVVYQRDPWVSSAGSPSTTGSMNLQQGEFGRRHCTYDNTTDHDVSYGESTTNEMCYFVLFYTPFDKLNGCVN